MRHLRHCGSGLLGCAAWLAMTCAVQAQTEFTYQGKLLQSGAPETGPLDLAFRLYDAAAAGGQIGSELALPAFAGFSPDGTFTVDLDFGAGAFEGSDRWLEIWVDGAALSPRQPVYATPYAMHALTVADSAVPFVFGGLNAVFTGGNVGIGTSNPQRLLDLQAPEAMLRLTSTDTTIGRTSRLQFKGSANPSPFHPIGAIEFYSESDELRSIISTNKAGSTNAQMSFNVTPGEVYQLMLGADLVRVTDKLELRRGTDLALAAEIGTNGNDSFFQLQGGNVGIGTTIPGAPLHVMEGSTGATAHGNASAVFERTGNNYLSILSPDANERGLLFGDPESGVNGGIIYNNDSTPDGFEFRTGGNVTRMVIESNGDVGIGTDFPTFPLHVESNDTAILGTGENTGVYGLTTNSTGGSRGVLGFAASTTGTTYGVHGLNASTAGIGVYGQATASSAANFGVYGRAYGNSGRGVYGWSSNTTGVNYGVYGISSSTNGRGVYGYATANSGTTYGVYGEADSSGGYGVVAVNNASSGAAYGLFAQSDSSTGRGLHAHATHSSGVNYGVRGSTASSNGFDFYASGSGLDYGSNSSRRWKNNIENIGAPLEKLAQLRGVYFDWDEEHGGHHDVGMIAEEVALVLPEIVRYDETGVEVDAMDYTKLAPLLVEAVNALRVEKDAEITSLQLENELLHARLAALEQLVEQIRDTQIEEHQP